MKPTIRESIEKAIQEAASWNIVQNGTGAWSYGHEYPFELDQATSQILKLIEGIVPPEKPDDGSDNDALECGYNQCIADIRSKMK